jgi:translation initiation factor IF-2
LGISSKKLLELCRQEGIDAKAAASTLTDSEAGRLRVLIQAEKSPKQAEQSQAPRNDQEVIPPPLSPRADPAALAFAPKLGAIRRRPPQQGVVAAPAEESVAKPLAEAVSPAAVATSTAVTVEPAAPPPQAEVQTPPVSEVAAPEVEVAEALVVEVAPVTEEAPPAEALPEAPVEAPPKVSTKKIVSIDEFVIEVPKAIGRIEGIVPKKIPVRERKKGKEKEKEKEKEGKTAEGPVARAHPQAIGVPPTRRGESLTEAGRKAREVAERTIKESHKQPASQRGLVADTNRPQSGRSASAGGRRTFTRAGGPIEEAEAPEIADSEDKKLHKPVKKAPQKGRRGDRVELDSDVEVLGASHIRLERGESIRKPLGERRRRQRPERHKRADEPVVQGGTVEIAEPVTVKSFCTALGVQATAVISRLMRTGQMVTVNGPLSKEAAEVLALEFGIELKVKEALNVEQKIEVAMAELDKDVAESTRQPRSPIVTFLGHVDHGKTSLMDRIRQTHVVDGEAGGITQHIGAYRVQVGDRAVTFLDTPGHEAFTAMRARGAQVTDIVVLVVAADDGIMPQTLEAINHARAAEVPIVVALNKVDKAEANVQRVMGQLAEHDLIPEEWGGKTIVAQTSATTGQGVDQLLESLLLEAEMLELSGNSEQRARGAVIEAEMQEGLGPVMTLLVQDGTLHVGDVVLAGTAFGRVRAMTDEKFQAVQSAGPSMPVRVSGLTSVPNAGDRFYGLENLQEARGLAEEQEQKQRLANLATRQHVTLENLMEQMASREVKMLNVILKADVQGSVEVLRKTLGELKHPEVQVSVLHAGVGAINESDVLLADASDAVVIGFQVIADEQARTLAEAKGVDIRIYTIIYNIMDDLKKALEGMLAPEKKQQVTGHVVIRQTFKVSRLGTVAGAYVTDGVIRRTSQIRVSRQGTVVYEGKLESLKRFKDDAREVLAGLECGLKIAGFDDLKIDDVIEAIETIEVKRTL